MNYLLGGMAIVIAALGLWVKILSDTNNKLHENEGVYKTQIQQLADSIQSKDKDLDLCSQRTRQLKDDADKRAEQVKKAQEEAKKKSAENLKLADQLLTAKRPEGMTACQNAERIINEYIKDRHQSLDR